MRYLCPLFLLVVPTGWIYSEYIAADYLLSPWKNILRLNFEGEVLPLTFLRGHVIILLTLQLHKR